MSDAECVAKLSEHGHNERSRSRDTCRGSDVEAGERELGGERRDRIGPVGDHVRGNIRALRQSQRLTTDAFAAKMREGGRPLQANGVTKIEMGNRAVDVDDLVAIARVLGVEPQQPLKPFECLTCGGKPPEGFTCRTCGAE
jgi:hypothetical protein